MPMRTQDWQRLGDIVPNILAAWKRQLESPFYRLLAVWESAVSPEVAAHATPLALDRTVLVLSVPDSVWATELCHFHADRIIQDLNKALSSPVVRRLRFVCRPPTRQEDPGGGRYAQE